jgi:hypothetical protein
VAVMQRLLVMLVAVEAVARSLLTTVMVHCVT